ncbi:hypothetical protein ACTXGQ_09720 [Marinobacter sp. 1Y8]
MTSQINSESAEQIGRPIIERIIKAHSDADYGQLVELIPNMEGKLLEEEFIEAATSLEPLGKVASIEYLGHFSKVKEHLVLWRVRYELAEEDVLWHLYLSDNESEIKAVGLFFDL